MAASRLSDFVDRALQNGASREDIRKVLGEAGWSEDQVRDALDAYADIPFVAPVPRYKREASAREAFLYIVYFGLLGALASYLGGLAFGFVDVTFADSLFSVTNNRRADGLRWSVAVLLVGSPIFYVLGSFLAKQRRAEPERRASRVRAWLTYIAMIFAAMALIGDFIAVVYTFLSGEIGLRFALKAAVVAIIAGAVLITNLRDAERATSATDWISRAIAIFMAVVTAVLIVWAFSMIRSPGAARAKIADEQRIDDLKTIAHQIDCFYTEAGAAPTSLAELEAARAKRVSGGAAVLSDCAKPIPEDPTSGEDYGLSALDEKRAEVCMLFQIGWRGEKTLERTIRENYRATQRTIVLPEAPGEACFTIEAAELEQEED